MSCVPCRSDQKPLLILPAALPRIGQNHHGRLLSNHHRRRVGVTANERRHDRGIDHAQVLHAMHSQARIDHDQRGVVHFAGADRVVDGARFFADELLNPCIALHRAAGEDLRTAIGVELFCGQDLARKIDPTFGVPCIAGLFLPFPFPT
jgi:hypothetical protein